MSGKARPTSSLWLKDFVSPRLRVPRACDFREPTCRQPDPLEAFGDDIVRRGEERDENVELRQVISAVVFGPFVGIAQQADHVIGKEFAIEQERRERVQILVEQFAELIEAACRNGKPVRIGVNWGSLDQELLARLMDANSALPEPQSAQQVMRETQVDFIGQSNGSG